MIFTFESSSDISNANPLSELIIRQEQGNLYGVKFTSSNNSVDETKFQHFTPNQSSTAVPGESNPPYNNCLCPWLIVFWLSATLDY